MHFLYVFIGGGLGAVTRYGLSLLIAPSSKGFPYQTLAANVVSSFILGYLMAHFVGKDYTTQTKLLLATGFCGGFSTFSTFSAETFQLINNNQVMMALSYITVSIVLCLLAIWMGFLSSKLLHT